MNQSTNSRVIFLNNRSKEELLLTINTTYANERESVIERAERLLMGDYLFQNEWDMERTQEIVSLPLESIDWNFSPTADLEFSYMLHRHAYLMDLVIAYVYTDDQKYIDYLNKFLIQYVKENPNTKENQKYSWRTIDVAIRLTNIVHLIEILTILEFEIDESVHQELDLYFDYIIDNLEYKRSQSNWVAIESSAALVYAKYKNIKDDRFKRALDIYEICLDNQVLTDGLQWEQSFMYHHEVLITGLHVVSALKKETPQSILNNVKDMYQASLDIMRVDGTQSNFGDSDLEDMKSLMLASEKILKVNLLKDDIDSTLFDYLLTGSSKDYERYESHQIIEKFDLKESGIAIVKDYKNQSNLMFTYGPLGGGHGHDDLMHLEWFVNSKNFLVDSGRYTYFEEENSRLYFKRPHAHNTIVVDDESYNEHTDSWGSQKVTEAVNEKVIHKNKVSLFETGHFGYSQDDLVYVNRRALYTNDDVLVVFDYIKSKEKHRLTSNFVLHKPSLTIHEDEVLYNDEDLEMKFKVLSDYETILKSKIEVSYQYNEKHNTERLEISNTLSDGHLLTAILKSEHNVEKVEVYSDSNKLYTDDVVECVRYTKDDRDCYILIQHQEPNNSRRSYRVMDYLFYGRIIYFEIVDGQLESVEKIY